MKGALIVGAHPDDAELMAGGIIALLRDRGVPVTVAVFTTSEVGAAARLRRRQAAAEAAAILGHELVWLADGAYDQVADITEPHCVTLVDELVRAVDPDLVITHSTQDSHGDHTQVARAVIASTRHCGASFLSFGPSEFRAQPYNTFVPNVFVDVSPYMERKAAAIACYNYAGASYRPLRADDVAALNRATGVLCGAEYAEGLALIRQFGLPCGALVGGPRAR